jgi:AraC-like DNA-binding protein
VNIWFGQLEALAQDPDIIIKLVEGVALDKQGPISHWFFSGYDLSATIRRINAGIGCLQSGAFWTGEQSGALIKWVYRNPVFDDSNKLHDGIRSAIFMTKVLRHYLGKGYKPVRVMLPRHSQYPGLYQDFFGCDIGWNHPHTEVWLTARDRHIYSHVKPSNKARLAMNFSDLDDLLNMPDPQDEIKVIYETVNYVRNFGLPTIENSARLLGLSPQQFSRRVRAMGLNFTVIVDYVLSTKAVNLFNLGWDIASVSKNLGYTNVASFNRMFKKNLGVTPSQYLYRFHGNN